MSLNIVWIVGGIGIVAAIAKWAWADERDAQSHLGFVSHRWLADHRLSQVSDPQR
jgi:predicted ferric reductase